MQSFVLKKELLRPALEITVPLVLIAAVHGGPWRPLDLILLFYFGLALFFRFGFSHHGTPLAHPRCFKYRAPQILWTLLVVSLLSSLRQLVSPSAGVPLDYIAYPLVLTYYSLRFGALRVLCLACYLVTVWAAFQFGDSPLSELAWGSVAAIATAFLVDMYWNWDLKRLGVIVPGPDPDIISP